MDERNTKSSQNILARLCEPLGSGITAVFALGFLGWLTGLSFVWFVCTDTSTFDEFCYLIPESIFTSLLRLAVFSAVLLVGFRLLFYRVGTPQAIRKRAIAIVCLSVLFSVCFAAAWTHSVNAIVDADQAAVWQMAVDLVQGNAQTVGEGYMKTYPHQYVMALFLAPFAALSGGNALPFWGYFGAVCVGFITAALCAVTCRLTGSYQVTALCGVLCACCVPLALYAPFVYGTLPGLALALWGLYGVLRLCQGGGRKWWLLPAFCLPLSYAAYQTMLIFSVAALLILLFAGLHEGKRGLLRLVLPAFCVFALVLAVQPAGQWLFRTLTGAPASEGMPLSARLYMGMTAVGGPGEGGYTYDQVQYLESVDYSKQLTDEHYAPLLKEAIADYLRNPTSMVFFVKKTIRQWIDGWFGVLTMVYPQDRDFAANSGWLASRIAGGSLFSPLQLFNRVYLSAVYLFAAVGTWVQLRRHRTVWALLPAVCFVGGFLFQLFWETKSRYCLPFFLLLLPLAAIGFDEISKQIDLFCTHHLQKTQL